MKTLVSIILLSSLMIAPLLAIGPELTPTTNKSAIVDNLAVGLKSDNQGLRISSAVVVREVIDKALIAPEDFSATLIPLLRMLDYGKTAQERIAAAVALYSLNNDIGIYRLRGSARFDNNEKVRTISKNLYYSYHTLNHSTYFLDF
jgi:HEAT repeat protein